MYSENRTKHTNTICGQTTDFLLCVKSGVPYGYHYALKGKSFKTNWKRIICTALCFILLIFTATATPWHRHDEMSVASSSVGFSEVYENSQFFIQHQTRLFWKPSVLDQRSSHTAASRPSLNSSFPYMKSISRESEPPTLHSTRSWICWGKYWRLNALKCLDYNIIQNAVSETLDLLQRPVNTLISMFII
jgi:hypothetical protein